MGTAAGLCMSCSAGGGLSSFVSSKAALYLKESLRIFEMNFASSRGALYLRVELCALTREVRKPGVWLSIVPSFWGCGYSGLSLMITGCSVS